MDKWEAELIKRVGEKKGSWLRLEYGWVVSRLVVQGLGVEEIVDRILEIEGQLKIQREGETT